jgi:hypothetical protein
VPGTSLHPVVGPPAGVTTGRSGRHSRSSTSGTSPSQRPRRGWPRPAPGTPPPPRCCGPSRPTTASRTARWTRRPGPRWITRHPRRPRATRNGSGQRSSVATSTR